MHSRYFGAVFLLLLAGCRGGASPVDFAPQTAAPNAPRVTHAPHASSSPSIALHPSKLGATVSDLVLGANEATWNDVTLSTVAPAFRAAGLHATRWPGGSESDNYH